MIQHCRLLLKPIQLISSNIEVAKAGKVPPGKTEIPFEFPLNTKSNKVLYETYHGVFVNIQVGETKVQDCEVWVLWSIRGWVFILKLFLAAVLW